MKKILIWFAKAIVAGAIAILILSAFSMLYYNNGIRKTSDTGATDYVWENRFHSLGYEGYAWGQYDEFGYNNAYDLLDDEIDILIMGSSHMNAYNVSVKQSTAYVLNELMDNSELKYKVYNIGMEGHDFYACTDNLDDALETYSPRKYVVMETRSVELSMTKMEQVLRKERMRAPAYDSGVIYYLQKIPYLRLLQKKVREFQEINMDMENEKEEAYRNIQTETEALVYDRKLNQYLERLGRLANENKIILILFYIPPVNVNNDGSISTNDDFENIVSFAGNCRKYGIEFIDMTETFIDNYEMNYELPYGFSNTEIGKGHLNCIGHELVANKVYDTIVNIEGK